MAVSCVMLNQVPPAEVDSLTRSRECGTSHVETASPLLHRSTKGLVCVKTREGSEACKVLLGHVALPSPEKQIRYNGRNLQLDDPATASTVLCVK